MKVRKSIAKWLSPSKHTVSFHTTVLNSPTQLRLDKETMIQLLTVRQQDKSLKQLGWVGTHMMFRGFMTRRKSSIWSLQKQR